MTKLCHRLVQGITDLNLDNKDATEHDIADNNTLLLLQRQPPQPRYKHAPPLQPDVGRAQVHWNTGERAHLIRPRIAPFDRPPRQDSESNPILQQAPYLPRGIPKNKGFQKGGQ